MTIYVILKCIGTFCEPSGEKSGLPLDLNDLHIPANAQNGGTVHLLLDDPIQMA